MADHESADLLELLELQDRSARMLMAAMSTGVIDYPLIGEYLPVGRQLLERARAWEQRHPGGLELHAVAGPLAQQLSMYADWMQSEGDRDAAEALRREADELAERYLTAEQGAGHLRSRAMEAADAGRFHDALIGLERAQQAFVAAGRPIEAAQTLLQLANVYEWLGDHRRALDTMDAAQALVAERLAVGPPSVAAVAASIVEQRDAILRGDGGERQGEDALSLRRLHFELVQGRARVNRRLGHHDVARALFEEARAFVEESVPVGVDFHLAAVALDTGDLAEARRLLARVAPAFEHGLLRPRRGALRQLQSDLALRSGDAAGALARADEGLAEQAVHPDLELAWKLQWRRARALTSAGDTAAALAAYREAAHVADTVRLAPLGYELDTTFVADKAPMIEEAIDLAVEAGDGAAAAELIELVKARALAAVLSRPAEPRDGDDPDAQRFDALSLEVDALSFRGYAGAATVDEQRRRAALLVERREVMERIRVRDRRWRGVTVPPAVDVAATCALLGDTDRAALVLHVRHDRLVAALLTGDGAVVGVRTWDAGTADDVRAYAGNLTLVQPDHFLADLSGERGVDLRHLLPDAVADALAVARTLLVVPHGVLHVLPWATMTLDGERLFASRAVGVLPNLSALAYMEDDPLAPQRVGLLGDPDYAGLTRYRPLAHAGPELTDVERLYGPGGLVAPVARGADARQEALARLLRQGTHGSVLHVACHADVAADEPLASGLILTGSTLDAGELIRLGCSFPEVVLSACSTGWRPQTTHGLELAGDDALGLVAAFLEAGARSLLVSITQAKDDVARRCMVAWHRGRRSGATPLGALRHAQLELSQEGVPVWAWAGITAYSSR